MAIIIPIVMSSVLGAVAVTFFGGLFYDWIVQKPFGVFLRVWLYGRGWKKWIGIGRKSKWFGDEATSASGLG